jgi:hypothetical protein
VSYPFSLTNHSECVCDNRFVIDHNDPEGLSRGLFLVAIQIC